MAAQVDRASKYCRVACEVRRAPDGGAPVAGSLAKHDAVDLVDDWAVDAAGTLFGRLVAPVAGWIVETHLALDGEVHVDPEDAGLDFYERRERREAREAAAERASARPRRERGTSRPRSAPQVPVRGERVDARERARVALRPRAAVPDVGRVLRHAVRRVDDRPRRVRRRARAPRPAGAGARDRDLPDDARARQVPPVPPRLLPRADVGGPRTRRLRRRRAAVARLLRVRRRPRRLRPRAPLRRLPRRQALGDAADRARDRDRVLRRRQRLRADVRRAGARASARAEGGARVRRRYLEVMVPHLVASGCATASLNAAFLLEASGDLWATRCGLGRGETLVYWREPHGRANDAWSDVNVGEEAAMNRHKVIHAVDDDAGIFVHVNHATNTGAERRLGADSTDRLKARGHRVSLDDVPNPALRALVRDYRARVVGAAPGP